MPREEFEKLVAQGYEQLPQWVREKIKNVALLVEDEPSDEERHEQGLADDETLLGLYKGIPLSARGENYGIGMTLPDTITLYQLPIEDEAEEELRRFNLENPTSKVKPPEFEKMVRKVVIETIWHEFAHHFGMDEHAVRLREGERYPHQDGLH